LQIIVAAALLATSCSRDLPDATSAAPPSIFVGSEQCATCHAEEFRQWQGSHHQMAMQSASAASVLGDFSDVTVGFFDSKTAFIERDGKYFVNTENAVGDANDHEITHTFGVKPLQQYLVDGPAGRKQALQFAWDARSSDDGGQNWYHLYPDEQIGPDDPLHWTGKYFNWNYMCAECHSTDVQLKYDVESNSFDTSFTEVSVGCEACHGPASKHVRQASAESFDQSYGLQINLNERDGAAWIMEPTTGIAQRNSPNRTRLESESCGRCHSRRSVVAETYEYGVPLTDTHMPSLLDENLYHADGRIQGEVYVYGSFLQSKMYAAGVTCSDCHNPHSGELLAGPNPNDTCSTCHLESRFASSEHNEEAIGDCVSCHMPATMYMGVDDRRDHSFRLPGTTDDPDHYGSVIAAGRQGDANEKLLKGIANESYPPIARATMLTLLGPISDQSEQLFVLEQLSDSDPLLRIGALRALQQQPPDVRLMRGASLLRDPLRSVRIEAALTYVDVRDLLPIEDARAFPAAADEYRQAMSYGLAMPESALNLADFETRLGNTDAAAKNFEHAIRVGIDFAPARHAYGLYLVRRGDSNQALPHLLAATRLAPDTAQFVYVYGVALNSLGQPDEALRVLSDASQRFPDNFDISWALATMYRDQGNLTSARSVAAQLAVQFPDDPRVTALEESLRD